MRATAAVTPIYEPGSRTQIIEAYLNETDATTTSETQRMTQAQKAAECMRRWWQIRKPSDLAEFGITSQRIYAQGKWGISFGWKCYLTGRAENIAKAQTWDEAIDIAQALLDAIATLRTPKKPATSETAIAQAATAP